MGARLATWAMSGVRGDTWRVHSTLHLSEGSHVTAIDCKSGACIALGVLFFLLTELCRVTGFGHDFRPLCIYTHP